MRALHDADFETASEGIDILLEHIDGDVAGLLDGSNPRLRNTDALREFAL